VNNDDEDDDDEDDEEADEDDEDDVGSTGLLESARGGTFCCFTVSMTRLTAPFAELVCR